jgi:hypothetical protein
MTFRSNWPELTVSRAKARLGFLNAGKDRSESWLRGKASELLEKDHA